MKPPLSSITNASIIASITQLTPLRSDVDRAIRNGRDSPLLRWWGFAIHKA
jgi:hypothetical protein